MKYGFLLFCMLTLLLSGTGTAGAQVTGYPLQTKYPNIILYKGETPQKMVALTFDDGPDQRFTPQVLDVLNKYHVKATFFLLGSRVAKYPHVAKRIIDEGHVVGNHTYWHPQLTKTGVHNMKWEISRTEQAIKTATGYKTKLFRAPYGALNEEQVQKLKNLGYRGIGWSIDTEDWKGLTAKQITNNVGEHVHSGDIILMHSAGHWTQDLSGTVRALDRIIPMLKREGYTFVTIPQLWDASHSRDDILK